MYKKTNGYMYSHKAIVKCVMCNNKQKNEKSSSCLYEFNM